MLFFDSLGTHHPAKIQENIIAYLQEAWSSNDRGEATVDKDLLPLVITESPQQGNGCDCGILVLRNAKDILQEWPIATQAEVDDGMQKHFTPELFSPSDISNERRMLRQLLQTYKDRYERELRLREISERRAGVLSDDSASSPSDVEVEKDHRTMSSG
ncbi:conserved unknown protein [Ectocarpus siliculosus]|uniref:Ubiquitin-like protease family profile domain-containing protein n=1 Tax=Ectocarpus siliculosus TaxID=2880 RepID=D7FTK7_ECTSI|nr:conserved unknown protein [Ectocarpus siliculosus]|eukprot:CBJ31398.1 conserved unknown protein [Ectocarpus siliculosus]